MKHFDLNFDTAVTTKGLIINHRRYIPLYHRIMEAQR
jgi:hypothetical protein